MGSVGTTKLLALVTILGCGGHSEESSACSELCEIHAGCGYEVSTCTERCETTLQDSPCAAERRALLRCVQNEPRESVMCIELGPFSSFGPRDSTVTCHSQHEAVSTCECSQTGQTLAGSCF